MSICSLVFVCTFVSLILKNIKKKNHMRENPSVSLPFINNFNELCELFFEILSPLSIEFVNRIIVIMYIHLDFLGIFFTKHDVLSTLLCL